MKTLNILVAFTVKTSWSSENNCAIHTYNYHLYTCENNSLVQYLEHGERIFAGYNALLEYSLEKALKFFGTTKNNYSTIHYL